jgi:hypothetical protein
MPFTMGIADCDHRGVKFVFEGQDPLNQLGQLREFAGKQG